VGEEERRRKNGEGRAPTAEKYSLDEGKRRLSKEFPLWKGGGVSAIWGERGEDRGGWGGRGREGRQLGVKG